MMESVGISYEESGLAIPEALNPDGYRNLVDFFLRTTQRYAERPAFTSFGRTLTYGELDRLSASFAVYLQRHTGLQPGDRIAIQLPNLIQYPVVLYGALRAGLVIVNTNPLYTPDEMAHQFRDAGVRALVIHKSMAHKAQQILPQTDIRTVFVTQVGDLHGFVKRTLINATIKYIKRMEPYFYLPEAISLRDALLLQLGETPQPVESESRNLAVLQYTGGTTGNAKGAMLTHANLLANMLQGGRCINVLGASWCETVILPLPLYHIYAFTVAQIVFASGGHAVLIANPRDIDGFVSELKHWRMSAFIGLNTLFSALCRRDGFRALDFSRLELTLSGGMALTNAAADAWHGVTGNEIIEAYGLTETSPAVSINPPDANQPGTIGVPLPYTEVRVVDVNREPVADGVPGELCVRGPQVMAGYWQRDVDTRESIDSDGFLYTGDIAVRQSDGYLRIVDRAKDLIIVSGFNVYPNEVEDVVALHPDVEECAVIGVPDEDCGEIVKLFVVSQDAGLTREALRDWCRERLTAYKVPRQIEFVDELPKSTVGKVLRRMLRDN